MMARLTSWMALVTWIPRGQASVQLNVVLHRNTPLRSARVSRRSRAPWSRESKMNRWALTMAAGPMYSSSPQKIGHEVVQVDLQGVEVEGREHGELVVRRLRLSGCPLSRKRLGDYCPPSAARALTSPATLGSIHDKSR